MREDRAKKWGPAAAVAIIGAAIGTLATIGWAPWQHMTKDDAKDTHAEMTDEFKERLQRSESSAYQHHDALLLRIQSTDEDVTDLKTEFKEQRRILWKINANTQRNP